MTIHSNFSDNVSPKPTLSWKQIVSRYQSSSVPRASWQLFNSIIPYFLVWVAMYFCMSISWWLVPPLIVVASGLMIRTFIIFHDCGHGSFFKTRRANTIWGYITGVLTFTPYYQWRWEHAIHHSTAGNLDKRGTGDISTMTVDEYLQSSRKQKIIYRITRNPFVLFGIAPVLLFLIWQRIPNPKAPRREKNSVHITNVAILFYAIVMSLIFGWQFFLIVQSLIMMIGGAIGVWLFYVQHQFEGVYWERSKDWDYAEAALNGSSFYKLPKIFQWFSGNIGFHHIHHLSPRIPNYYLEKCHKAEPFFQKVKPITLFKSFRSFTYRLWDEQKHRLVGYRHLRQMKKNKNIDK